MDSTEFLKSIIEGEKAAGRGVEANGGEPEAGNAAGDNGFNPAPGPESETIARLEQELAEEKERVLRVLADFDNFRKRTEASRLESALEEKRRFIQDVLEVMDNFQRAVDQMAGDSLLERGMAAIHRQFFDILKKHGVERIEADGRPFDPRFYEVLDMAPAPGKPDMTVQRTYKDGWLFQGRLLRPALVQVVRNEPELSEPAGTVDVEA